MVVQSGKKRQTLFLAANREAVFLSGIFRLEIDNSFVQESPTTLKIMLFLRIMTLPEQDQALQYSLKSDEDICRFQKTKTSFNEFPVRIVKQSSRPE